MNFAGTGLPVPQQEAILADLQREVDGLGMLASRSTRTTS